MYPRTAKRIANKSDSIFFFVYFWCENGCVCVRACLCLYAQVVNIGYYSIKLWQRTRTEYCARYGSEWRKRRANQCEREEEKRDGSTKHIDADDDDADDDDDVCTVGIKCCAAESIALRRAPAKSNEKKIVQTLNKKMAIHLLRWMGSEIHISVKYFWVLFVGLRSQARVYEFMWLPPTPFPSKMCM